MVEKKVKTGDGKPKVRIYTTPTCPYCHAAKDFLRELKVRFVELDVSKDKKAAGDMIEKSGQMSVPVIDIDGVIIVGFDRGAVKKALKIH